MGDARRRRLLLKAIPPVVVSPDQPGHRYRCFAAKEPVTPGIRCGCDVYDRLERRRSKAATIALLGIMAAVDVPR